MEEKKFVLINTIIIIILAISLTVSLYTIFTPNKISLGTIYKDVYSSLDYSIYIIGNNMNAITTNNEWTKLKNINSDDKQLNNTYNLLLSDIKKCYLLANDLDNKTYKNIKILSFKNKEYTTKDELAQLQKNDNCLKSFNKYNTLVLSDNQVLSERIKKQISILIDYKEEPSADKSFYELLSDEASNLSRVASLSNWLKIEYNSHK